MENIIEAKITYRNGNGEVTSETEWRRIEPANCHQLWNDNEDVTFRVNGNQMRNIYAFLNNVEAVYNV